MQPRTINHYFRNFVRTTVPAFGIIFGIFWSIPLVPMFGVVPGIIGGVGLALLYSLGLAWFLAWLATRRKPLARLEDATGRYAWKYVDLSGPCEEVYAACSDLLRARCIPATVGEYGRPGLLVGETRSTLWTWGAELLVMVECFGSNMTRVQILSRSLVPTNIVDFGSNKQNVAALVDLLRARYSYVAEG